MEKEKDLKTLNELLDTFHKSLLIEGYKEEDIGIWYLNKSNDLLEEDMLLNLVDHYLEGIEQRLDFILQR